MGDGIYKSAGGGETWTHMGLKDTGRIRTIAVNPSNENVVLVCALGRATTLMTEVDAFNKANAGKLPAISDRLR